jgi:hypothetical protein
MPKELPHRSISWAASREAESTLDSKKRELKAKKIDNGTPPKDKAKPWRMLEDDVFISIRARLAQARVDLESTPPRAFGGTRADFDRRAEPWRTKTTKYGRDLAGFWNDVRQDIGVRVTTLGLEAQEAERFNKLLDLLEVTENDNGLGACPRI